MEENQKKIKKFNCEYCRGGFTRKDSLNRHQKNGCKVIKLTSNDLLPRKDSEINLQETLMAFTKKVEADRLKDKKIYEEMITNKITAELKNKQFNVTNNQVLQVVCVGNNDNYLDMLTEQLDFERALGFIRECALSSLSGDCRLIERIYLNQNNESGIHYVDKNRTKLEYYNEKKEKIIDHRGFLLGKKLANNLQNSYLKGVNYLITQNLFGQRRLSKFCVMR